MVCQIEMEEIDHLMGEVVVVQGPGNALVITDSEMKNDVRLLMVNSVPEDGAIARIHGSIDPPVTWIGGRTEIGCVKTIGAWKGDKAELMVIEKCDRLHHTGMAHPQEIITMQEALLQTITAVMDHKMVIILILWEGLGSHQNFLMISEDEIGNEAQTNAAEKGIDNFVKLSLNSIGPKLDFNLFLLGCDSLISTFR